LVIGYSKFECYVLAADLLAENTDLAIRMIGQPTLDFLDAHLLCSVSKEEVYRKLDNMCKVVADGLRRLMRKVEDSKKTHDQQQQTSLTLRFEASVNDMISLFLAQAKIF
jgi:hypothetical protein